jgi:DNA replication protein DnaC
VIRAIPPADRTILEQGLKRLKLRRVRELLDDVNELALREEPSYLDFLAYIVDQEIAARENSISRQSMLDLATLGFVEAHENIVLLGPQGVGKTHLAVALGIAAVNAGYRVLFMTADSLTQTIYSALADGTLSQHMNRILRNDLIILDEVGYLSLDATGSNHLFQVIAKAYETRSLIVTSNLEFQEWGELFDKPATAAAVLDRLLHHAHIITLKGESYRMRSRLRVPPTKEV